jgi:purine-binding chemotaxis protein CheW
MDSQILLLVFVLDDRRYALRLSQVQRVILAVDAAPLPDAPGVVLGVIDVQGTLVPLFNIRKRFGVIERQVEPRDQFIIARTSRRNVALAVDHVMGVVDCSADRIVEPEAILDSLEIVAGAVQLPDGLVLIHDLDRFLSLPERRAMEDALQAMKP